MKRFCVNCGKETNELIGSLCTECYLKKYEVLALPEEFVIDFDKRSGKVRIGRDWVIYTTQVIGEMIGDKILSLAKPKKIPISGIDVTIEQKEDDLFASVLFSAEIEGVLLPIQKMVKVRLRKTISDASMKVASNYHEAIIQVRFKKKPTLADGQAKMSEVQEQLEIQRRKIELSQVVNSKNVPGGFDLFIGSAKAAKIVTNRLAKKYNLKVIYSNKMIGMNDNGTTKYRHTYCIKFE